MGADVAPKPAINFDDNVAAGLRAMGVTEEAIAEQQGKRNDDEVKKPDCELHADNWDSVMFFLKVQTQWVYASGGLGSSRLGFNHPALEANMRMRGIKRSKQEALMDDMLAMELAVLEVDSERAMAAADKEAKG